MKKMMIVMVGVVGLTAGVSFGAVVNSISDDFSGDLGKWNVGTSPTANATVTVATESGYLKESITTSDTSYSTGSAVTKDSVDTSSANQVVMEWDFYYPSDKVDAHGYAQWQITSLSTGGAKSAADYYTVITGSPDRWHWLDVFDDSGNRTQYNLGINGEGWKIYNDHWYHGKLAMDFDTSEVTLTLQSDGSVYFDGSSTTEVSKTVSFGGTRQSSYYGYIYISSKSNSAGSEQASEHRTDNFNMYVPEPATIGLLLLGVVGLIRRK